MIRDRSKEPSKSGGARPPPAFRAMQEQLPASTAFQVSTCPAKPTVGGGRVTSGAA